MLFRTALGVAGARTTYATGAECCGGGAGGVGDLCLDGGGRLGDGGQAGISPPGSGNWAPAGRGVSPRPQPAGHRVGVWPGAGISPPRSGNWAPADGRASPRPSRSRGHGPQTPGQGADLRLYLLVGPRVVGRRGPQRPRRSARPGPRAHAPRPRAPGRRPAPHWPGPDCRTWPHCRYLARTPHLPGSRRPRTPGTAPSSARRARPPGTPHTSTHTPVFRILIVRTATTLVRVMYRQQPPSQYPDAFAPSQSHNPY